MVSPEEEMVVSRSDGLAETVITSCAVLTANTTSRISRRFTVTVFPSRAKAAAFLRNH